MIDLLRFSKSSPDEQAAYFLRRHPITQSGLIVSFVALLILPVAIIAYLVHFQPDFILVPAIRTVLVLIGSLFFLYAWLFLFQYFIDYYLDIWIVTNKRIVSIEQTGLFNRTISELRLYRVQDVTASVGGMLHTLLDYGDVEIQTAGEKERFLFEQISHPNRVAKHILELVEIDRQGQLQQMQDDLGRGQGEFPTKK